MGHLLAVDNVENVLLPGGNVGVRCGDLIGFRDGATDRAQLAFQGISDYYPHPVPLQAPCKRQRGGKTSNCQ